MIFSTNENKLFLFECEHRTYSHFLPICLIAMTSQSQSLSQSQSQSQDVNVAGDIPTRQLGVMPPRISMGVS